MKVSDWIKQHPTHTVTVYPDSPADKVANTFLSHPTTVRDLYVISPEGHILGHIRHSRLVQFLLAEYLPARSSHQIMERICGGSAEELMERDFVFAHPSEELDNVLDRMLEYEVENMPVIDDAHRITGNINLMDVLRAVQKK